MFQESKDSSSPIEISSPSTTRGSPQDDFSAIERSARVSTQVDESAAALERALQRQIDGRREERFFWIFTLVIFGDVNAFSVIQNWAGGIAIFLLELVFLLGLAKFLGVEHIIVPLERVLNKYIPSESKD